MGKGDKRSRRGKIFKGSYGKTRPQSESSPAAQRAQPEQRSATKKVTPAKKAGTTQGKA